ncbi:MAG: helix-turn-helix domain-containing protein [Lachnospiraceae bacterium]|nr:helix-turn-helix domain-containing protein [Lachnospiraceae bacterium]
MSKAVERALRVLIFIGNSEQHTTMSNICEELDIPKASASDILHTLMDQGFVRIVDEERKTLGLGEQILKLGSAYRNRTNYMTIIHAEMKALASQENRTIFYWICQQNKMMLMDRALSPTGIYPNVEVGAMETMDSLIGRVYREKKFGQEQMADRKIWCFAVPLFDVDGRMAGVISTYDLASLSSEEMQAKTKEALLACTKEIAGKIHVGY